MRKPKMATFFTVAQSGGSFSANVPALSILANAQPPTTTVAGPGQYLFKYFIAPTPIGSDAFDGLAPVLTGDGGITSGHGPWTLGSLLAANTGNPTNKQKANNALMAGNQVGGVGDKGVLSLANAGLSYTLRGGDGNVLALPSGTAVNSTVFASCNSSGQYVQGLGVLDGGCDGTQVSSMNMIGRFDFGTDCSDIIIDGFEVRNCMNGGIVYGQKGATPLPGWSAINCYVHHVYNCGDQFTATACSQSGNQVTIGGTITGTVRYGSNPTGVTSQLLTGLSGFINGFVSGTPGGAGIYTCTSSATVAGPVSVLGSPFAGSNTAGISFHGGTGYTQINNFIENVIDLNTALPNNARAFGIKNWGCINGTTKFNTVYATQATGFPTAGIEHKNIPQYGYTLANNYINLANAGNGNDVVGLAGDGENVQVINGHGVTVNNNIVISNPHAICAFPRVTGTGTHEEAMLVDFHSNTLIGAAGAGGFTRVAPAGQRILTLHDNIIDRPTPPSGGNGGDFRVSVDGVASIDFDLYPANYLLTSSPSGGGTLKQYSASPPLNGGISGLMADLTTGSGGATTGLEANVQIGTPVYANASGTKLKASDYQLAAGSPGKGKGTGGIDMGAWGGGQTQVGCGFRDPSG